MPRLVNLDGSSQDSVHKFPSVTLALVMGLVPFALRRGPIGRGFWLNGFADYARRRRIDWATGAVHVIRRSALERPAHPYSERAFMYSEDLALCWTLRQAGWLVEFEPRAQVVHVGSAAALQAFGDTIDERRLEADFDWYGSTTARLAPACGRRRTYSATARSSVSLVSSGLPETSGRGEQVNSCASICVIYGRSNEPVLHHRWSRDGPGAEGAATPRAPYLRGGVVDLATGAAGNGPLDVTLPKLLLAIGVVLIVLARPWRLIQRGDRVALVILVFIVVWLVGGSALRGDSADLKRTLGAIGFGAAALVLAWSAVRSSGERGARWIAIGIFIFGIVSFAAAALELFTWNLPGDPFLWLWNIARPQVSFLNEPGVSVVLQTHSMGADRVIRVSGLSWHPNILAMSLLMPAAFGLALICRGWLERKRARLIFGALLFALVAITIVWTLSRSAFIGLVLVILATTIVSWFASRQRRAAGRPEIGSRRVNWLAPLLAAVPLVALALVLEPSIIERLVASLTPSVPQLPHGPVSTAANASDIAAIHWEMIATGLRILIASPSALIIGPGLSAYTLAVHDPNNPMYLRTALGIPDPNSFWLSFALGGGIPGVVAILGLLALTWWRLVQKWRTEEFAPLSTGRGATCIVSGCWPGSRHGCSWRTWVAIRWRLPR